jgi:NAD(P)-dependent dehydrogenase (short-subunit alcohol dehydrogenase family)
MTTIQGAVAVVTGGASGIGRGIAEALIASGATVAIADIERDAVDATAAEIGATPFVTDVSQLDSVQALADAVVERFGGVDIVVNNAGIGPLGRLADLTMDDWRWIIDVNLYGVIHGVHVFLPLLESRGGGHIVNTSSMAALTPFQSIGSYAVTKSGVAALTEVLQAELASAGSEVRATLLLPGSIRTNIGTSSRNRPGGSVGALADAKVDLAFSNSSRWLEPADVGRIVVRAIELNDAFAITHPDRWPAVAERFARIEAAFAEYPPISGDR